MTKNYEAPWLEQASAPDYSALLDTGEWIIYFKSGGLYLLEDDGTEHGPFNNAAIGAGGGTGEIFVGAASMWPSTTAGSGDATKTEYTTNDQNLFGLAFDQTTQEHAEFTIWMPDDWDAGTVTFKAVWTANSGSGNAAFNLQGVAYADSDAIDASWGTAQEVIDTLLTAGDVHYSAESSAITIGGGAAAGELVQFRVYRNTGTPSDLDADAILLGIKVYYSKS